jgi:hypothetical protein
MSIYEQILNEDSTDAESYWSLVLCRYGIEYVEDPETHKHIPTVNRAQYTSIFADENYKSAIQYADVYQKTIYEEEAKSIDEIQKGILAISQKEEPFDIFICYKETDNNGRRTQDSVLANDLYHQLTLEGFKVFFSRITLEDKLGTAYEPYIFAALNSAKVMVVLGTKPEYFNAVWVKNEWSRYLALIKNDAKKVLIPAYRDMDPYDLPEEFSHLQAQDMSRLGFIQDLIRGIKKIIGSDIKEETTGDGVVVNNGNINIIPLLKRAFMFLEDGSWHEADEYCEKILDQDPENAQAYLGKLMAELQVCVPEDLKNCSEPFDNRNNYQKVIRFGNPKLTDELIGYIAYINERNEKARLNGIYNKAFSTMQNASNEAEYTIAVSLFKKIPGYKDATELAEACIEKAEICHKDDIYNSAKSYMKDNTIDSYEAAIKLFQQIPGWKDVDEQRIVCQKNKSEQEAERVARESAIKEQVQKFKNICKIALILSLVVVLLLLIISRWIKRNRYESAVTAYNEGKYEMAVDMFSELEDYEQSNEFLVKATEFASIVNAEVGDTVIFGSYEQDNNKSNGKEEIEWIVLDKSDNDLIMISKYVLDAQKYYDHWISATWEESDIRDWLNSVFLQSAFDKEQIKFLKESTISTADSTKAVDGGPDTVDTIYLLSVDEVEKYFSSNKARIAIPTEYAIEMGCQTYNGNAGTAWLLRSPGLYNGLYNGDSFNCASGVGYSGYVSETCCYSNDLCGVRPVICVDSSMLK